MPMLFVDCRRCASAFPSGIAPSSEDAGSVLISQVLEECPACGDTRRYDTPDFYFPPRGAESKATESKSGGPLVTPPPHDMGPVVSNQTRPVSIPPESIAEPGHSPP